jgi:hypothetical protein
MQRKPKFYTVWVGHGIVVVNKLVFQVPNISLARVPLLVFSTISAFVAFSPVVAVKTVSYAVTLAAKPLAVSVGMLHV